MSFRLLDFGEFYVNDGKGLGFGGNLRMLGLKLGDQGLDIGDRGFCFGIVGIVVFDICVYLLEDLDFLALPPMW